MTNPGDQRAELPCPRIMGQGCLFRRQGGEADEAGQIAQITALGIALQAVQAGFDGQSHIAPVFPHARHPQILTVIPETGLSVPAFLDRNKAYNTKITI